jgi:hypothetical protein
LDSALALSEPLLQEYSKPRNQARHIELLALLIQTQRDAGELENAQATCADAQSRVDAFVRQYPEDQELLRQNMTWEVANGLVRAERAIRDREFRECADLLSDHRERIQHCDSMWPFQAARVAAAAGAAVRSDETLDANARSEFVDRFLRDTTGFLEIAVTAGYFNGEWHREALQRLPEFSLLREDRRYADLLSRIQSGKDQEH